MTYSDNIYKPKVSIIIPVYNVKPYLTDALESVINQTYKNLEIIVIDDGSDDGSEKICDEYTKRYSQIKVIHKENGGLSSARNIGLDIMSGEYVTFLDSDDILYPEAIAKMLKSILEHNADCVVCDYIRIKTKPKKFNKKFLFKKQETAYSRIEALKNIVKQKIKVHAWGKLYKRELLKDIRFPLGQNYEDKYIILEIIDKTHKVVVIKDKLFCYRNRSDSITETLSIKNLQDFHKAYNNFGLYIKTHIPEIYEKSELKKNQQYLIDSLIFDYARSLTTDFDDKQNVLIWLEKKIKEWTCENNIKDYHLTTRLNLYFMFNFPKIFSIFGLFFLFVRKIIVWIYRKLKIIL